MSKEKILSQLYNGNIRPIEREIKKGSQCHTLSNEVNDLGEEITKLLDEDGLKLFNAYSESYGKLLHLNSEERFIQGFKMGGSLAIEIIYKDDELKV